MWDLVRMLILVALWCIVVYSLASQDTQLWSSREWSSLQDEQGR